MPRARNPNRDKAKESWLQSGGTVTNRSIAEKLGEPEKTISVWKLRDKWNEVLQKKQCSTSKKSEVLRTPPPAPKGNNYAVGNKGGGAPAGNKNAVVTSEYQDLLLEDLDDDAQQIAVGTRSRTALQIIRDELEIARAREKLILGNLRAYKLNASEDDIPEYMRFHDALTRVQGLIDRLLARESKLLLEEAQRTALQGKTKTAFEEQLEGMTTDEVEALIEMMKRS